MLFSSDILHGLCWLSMAFTLHTGLDSSTSSISILHSCLGRHILFFIGLISSTSFMEHSSMYTVWQSPHSSSSTSWQLASSITILLELTLTKRTRRRVRLAIWGQTALRGGPHMSALTCALLQ